MKIGIDAIGFYTPGYYLDVGTLAQARDIAPGKFYTGLGQRKMAMLPPDEDVVTMATNAAQRVLRLANKDDIETLMFATESGLDYSKAAGMYVHKLLELPAHCRVVELKQACYSATAAIQMAIAMLTRNPSKKILVIASDIARYGLNSSGESSQGAGAVAILLAANPRLLVIEPKSGIYTEDAMDFWRPNYCEEALVDGKYSCELYTTVLEKVWQKYSALSGRQFRDHDYFCYHVSLPRLVEKAHKRLAEINNINDAGDCLGNSLCYNREIGNCYTAALYVSVLSLLENTDKDLTDCRIGLYSYGSGCAGEFFSAIVQPGYKTVLDPEYHHNMLNKRNSLNYPEYEDFYNFKLPVDGGNFVVPKHATGQFRLQALQEHKRIYEYCPSTG
jgi:hydroxymethylglutaryl-CoA synthase